MVREVVVLTPDADLDLFSGQWDPLQIGAVTVFGGASDTLAGMPVPQADLEAGGATAVAHAFAEEVTTAGGVIHGGVAMRLYAHLAARAEVERGAAVLKLPDFWQD